MDAGYSKHKDRTPEQTIEQIKSILDEVGIQTQVVGENHPFEGAYSNRIQVVGTRIGANGKGTTEAYALASGYAELLERIQNGAIAQRYSFSYPHDRCGFYHFPDERLVGAEEAMDASDGIVDAWLERAGLASREEKLEYLRLLSAGMYARNDCMIPVVAYADLFSGKLTWLPPIVLMTVCSSNGLAAGNTMEEALVQALSEIFERYAQINIAAEQLTPPAIPAEHLDLAGLRETIADIERAGRYRVSMLDCSLGRGYPVVASLIVDKVSGTFGVRFGSHPSFAVALERTLTEAYQGRTAEQSASLNHIAPYDKVVADENLAGLVRNGKGAYPASLLAGEPSWEFAPWNDAEGSDNAGLLSRMFALLRHEGRKVLVRDNSHLGFPAYSVIVPGMSETDWHAHEGQEGSARAARFLGWFPSLSAEEEKLLLQEASFETGGETLTIDDLFARPRDGGTMLPVRLFGFLQLKYGDYVRLAYGEHEPAAKWFEWMAAAAVNPVAALYWNAMSSYARWRSYGLARADALELAGKLFPAAIQCKVAVDTESEDGGLKYYPPQNCRDSLGCESCQMGASGMCGGENEFALLERIMTAVGKSGVSQDELLGRLQPHTGC